ncbi:MAG: hypothetical protein LBG77_05130 [Dysgonamonadaceae bacterium]|jgi:predicted O-methyltransferase YrrM|nr:hypothetical protein [Dysgonamonadaceae bacterium]
MKFDLFRKIRYRKGYGVHSPFVYNLITKVIDEKHVYYAFEEIEKFRKTLENENNSLSSITHNETQTPAYGALLFRLVNFFKCKTILEIGASTGVMGLYLGMAAGSQGRCFLLEERNGLLSFLQDFTLARNLQGILCESGSFIEKAPDLLRRIDQADLIFINQTPLTSDEETIFRLFSPFIGQKTILILDNIGRNKERKKMWNRLKEHPQTRVMIDLDVLGLVFFDEKLSKRRYKAYLNHGKKQNLYENRRWRLHLFGGRKTGFKNTFPH